MSAARRASRAEAADTGPVSAEAQNLPEDNGLLARVLTNPAAAGLLLLVVAAVVAARGLVGSGMLSGGALLPAPGSAHGLVADLPGVRAPGSASARRRRQRRTSFRWPALGTLLLGKAWLVIDLALLLAVPVAAFGGYRFLLQATGSRPAALWGGATYGLLPVLTGAVQEGRLGTVVASLVLPWLAHAALFLAPSHSADRRWRAAWRTTLWLALLAAFTPLGLLLAVLLTAVVLVAGRVTDAATWSRSAHLAPAGDPGAGGPGPAAAVDRLGVDAPGGHAPGCSRRASRLRGWPTRSSWLDVVFGRPGAEGAPWWIGLGAVLAAVGALARPDTRRQVLRCWVVLVVALVTTAALSGVTISPAASGVPQPVWLGLPLLLAQAAGIAAAATAGAGVRAQLTGKALRLAPAGRRRTRGRRAAGPGGRPALVGHRRLRRPARPRPGRRRAHLHVRRRARRPRPRSARGARRPRPRLRPPAAARRGSAHRRRERAAHAPRSRSR